MGSWRQQHARGPGLMGLCSGVHIPGRASAGGAQPPCFSPPLATSALPVCPTTDSAVVLEPTHRTAISGLELKIKLKLRQGQLIKAD